MNPVRTSLETHYVSTTKPNLLMLFGETRCLLWESYGTHRYTVWVCYNRTLWWLLMWPHVGRQKYLITFLLLSSNIYRHALGVKLYFYNLPSVIDSLMIISSPPDLVFSAVDVTLHSGDNGCFQAGRWNLLYTLSTQTRRSPINLFDSKYLQLSVSSRLNLQLSLFFDS
jgi:hypothetical protein